MTQGAIPTLVLIALAAVVAPVVAEQTRGLRVPAIVFEIGFGIILGPYVLDVAHPGTVVSYLADMGLSYLIFLVGFELDPALVKGRPLVLAGISWLFSLALALALALALVASGFGRDTLILGLALTTTTLGSLMPVLSDAGVLSTRFGAYTIALASAAEFGPILLVGLLLINKNPLASFLLVLAYLVIAVAAAVLASRSQPPALVGLLQRHLHSSSQLPVRVSLLLALLFVLLALQFDFDLLLGAFAAGIVVRLITSEEDREAIGSKLSAIGFGFLVPIFFVVSGIHFDLHVLLATPEALGRVGLFLVLLLVARGVPAFVVYRKQLGRAERLPLALFSATGLPLIVVITTIGTSEGRMVPENAAALVGAGMISLFVFPVLGLWRLRASSGAPPARAGAPGA